MNDCKFMCVGKTVIELAGMCAKLREVELNILAARIYNELIAWANE